MHTRAIAAAAIVIGFASSTGCDPIFEYCVTTTHCSDGTAVEDLRVRFDHEGLYDTHTDAEGRTCSSSVGSPRAHEVKIELEKDGYTPLRVMTRSRDLGISGGRGLDVTVCVCELDEAGCIGRIVDDGPDAGADAAQSEADAAPFDDGGGG